MGIHAQVNYGVINTFDQPLNNEKRNFDIRSIPTSSVKNNDVSLTMSLKRILDKPKERYKIIETTHSTSKIQRGNALSTGKGKADSINFLHKKLISVLRRKNEIEVLAGPGLVSLFGETISKDTRQIKIGYTVRFGMIHFLNERFSLNSTLLYQRKGLKTKYNVWHYDATMDSSDCKCTISLGTSKTNSKMDYLSISFLARYAFHRTNFFVESGPYMGYLLKANTKTTNLWDNSYYYTNDIDRLKKIDFGISFSVGYKVKINENSSAYFQLIDNYGLLNVTKMSPKPVKTNSLSILVGLNFKKT